MVDKGTLFATTMIGQSTGEVSIRCAHRDIVLYPLAEVNMEVEVHSIYSVWKVAD